MSKMLTLPVTVVTMALTAAATADTRFEREVREITLPAGTMLPLALDTSVGSDISRIEDPVRAHLRHAVVVDGITMKLGMGDVRWAIYFNNLIGHLVIAWSGYLLLGGWKLLRKGGLPAKAGSHATDTRGFRLQAEEMDNTPLTWKQWLTCAVIIGLVASVIFLKLNVGIAAFADIAGRRLHRDHVPGEQEGEGDVDREPAVPVERREEGRSVDLLETAQVAEVARVRLALGEGRR